MRPLLCKQQNVHIIILYKSLEEEDGWNFAIQAISRDGDNTQEGKSDKVRMQNTVNCTHSGARWAMRTLIPFQAVGTLGSRMK